MIIKKCKNCSREFVIHNYRKDTAMFCSKKCSNNDKIGKIPHNKGIKTNKLAWNTGLKGYKSGKDNCNWIGEKICIDCGGIKSRHKNKRCSNCNKARQRGENIYNYKGGIHEERTNYEYKLRRLSIYERDWFTCQMPGCGYKGKDIQAHHIKKWKDYENIRFDKSNGITLCATCHNKTRNKEQQYEELFNNIIKLKC